MHIRIDRESSVPAYMQVYNELRNRIISGAFVHGAKLPSKRELARDCLVSLPTIEHAYQLLCDEGFCEMRLRSGCYVKYAVESFFPVSATEETIFQIDRDHILHNDNIPFSSVAAMLRKVILDYGERILMKSPKGGCSQLRDAICRYLSRCRNINVSREQVIIGSGAEYLYGICIQMLGRGKTVALESPSYEKIEAVYKANGAVCDMLEMDGEGIRTDELIRTSAEILHVTPFNSFPSGVTASAKRRQVYLEWAYQRNAASTPSQRLSLPHFVLPICFCLRNCCLYMNRLSDFIPAQSLCLNSSFLLNGSTAVNLNGRSIESGILKKYDLNESCLQGRHQRRCVFDERDSGINLYT